MYTTTNPELVECSACGNKQASTQQKNLCDNGWYLRPEIFGYYGGFDDHMEESGVEWNLCHDCIVKFLELFPKLGETILKGGHPVSDEMNVPCCKWAWHTKDVNGVSTTQLVGTDGKWCDAPADDAARG
jgi:hypothetical protein